MGQAKDRRRSAASWQRARSVIEKQILLREPSTRGRSVESSAFCETSSAAFKVDLIGIFPLWFGSFSESYFLSSGFWIDLDRFFVM